MAHWVGYANQEWSRQANRRNSVLVSAASENLARERTEILLDLPEGAMGTVDDKRGWLFVEVAGDCEFVFEGNAVSADLDLNTFKHQGA